MSNSADQLVHEKVSTVKAAIVGFFGEAPEELPLAYSEGSNSLVQIRNHLGFLHNFLDGTDPRTISVIALNGSSGFQVAG